MSLPLAIQELLEERELLDPQTLTPLELSPDGAWLLSPGAGRRFPVRDGIPCLVPQDAEPLAPVHEAPA